MFQSLGTIVHDPL